MQNDILNTERRAISLRQPSFLLLLNVHNEDTWLQLWWPWEYAKFY